MTVEELEGRVAALEIAAQFAVQAWVNHRSAGVWGPDLFAEFEAWFGSQIDAGVIPSPASSQGKEAMKKSLAVMFTPKQVIPEAVVAEIRDRLRNQ